MNNPLAPPVVPEFGTMPLMVVLMTTIVLITRARSRNTSQLLSSRPRDLLPVSNRS